MTIFSSHLSVSLNLSLSSTHRDVYIRINSRTLPTQAFVGATPKNEKDVDRFYIFIRSVMKGCSCTENIDPEKKRSSKRARLDPPSTVGRSKVR